MARKWCGFVPQNLSAVEEWTLVESCERQVRVEAKFPPKPETGDHRPEKQSTAIRVLKSK